MLTLQVCMLTLQVCMLTLQVCMLTLQVCMLTLQVCMLTLQVCMITLQVCMITLQWTGNCSCAHTHMHAHTCTFMHIHCNIHKQFILKIIILLCAYMCMLPPPHLSRQVFHPHAHVENQIIYTRLLLAHSNHDPTGLENLHGSLKYPGM